MGLLTTSTSGTAMAAPLTVKMTNTRYNHSHNSSATKASHPKKNWKQARDMSLHRKQMRKAITLILQPRLLPQQSSQAEFVRTIYVLESILLEQAATLGSYLDRTSLRRRLRQAQDDLTASQQNEPQQRQAAEPTAVIATTLRRRLQRRIFQLLQAKQQPQAAASSFLQHLSRKLEVSLYKHAMQQQQPEECYGKLLELDHAALQHRLMQLVQRIESGGP